MGYNLISVFLEYVGMYWKPRTIKFDKYAAKEMGFKSRKVHSWHLLWYEFKRMVKKFWTQNWWTYKSYKESDKKCPKCNGVTFVD